jgi:hypothetical protein
VSLFSYCPLLLNGLSLFPPPEIIHLLIYFYGGMLDPLLTAPAAQHQTRIVLLSISEPPPWLFA